MTVKRRGTLHTCSGAGSIFELLKTNPPVNNLVLSQQPMVVVLFPSLFALGPVAVPGGGIADGGIADGP